MFELRVGSDSPAVHVTPVTSGAKLQVLGLAPIKMRLGPKWDRLSNLVHKLFETAIANAQGPADVLVRVDELNYVLTLNALSVAEANVVCISIAKEVCEHLFGNKVDEVSVQSTVGEIPVSATHRVADIAKALQHGGIETVVTKSAFSGSPEPVVCVFEDFPASSQNCIAQIEKAHVQLARHRVKVGLFPVWDIHKRSASTLFFAPYMKNPAGAILQGKSALNGLGDAGIAEIEITLLRATEAYAARVRKAEKMGAVGVGVSYDTLNAFNRRIRYITALQKVRLAPSTPLVIKIENVPNGAPLNRVAELVAMLSLPNIKITVGLDSAWNFSRIDQRLGAAGICTSLPRGIDMQSFANFLKQLTQQAVRQKAFSVLDGISTTHEAAVAARAGIRFATGLAFGAAHSTGLEDVPAFPLAMPAPLGA